MQPVQIQNEAHQGAVFGSAVTCLGIVVVAIGLSTDQAVTALAGSLLLALGQFLVLRSLITWAVSKGTQPLVLELQLTRAHLSGVGLPERVQTSADATLRTVLAELGPRRCMNARCAEPGLLSHEPACPACGRATSPA